MTSENTLVEKALFPRLVVKSGGRVLREIEIRGNLSIGRAEENDLQLMDPKASRLHAEIQREGLTFVVRDLDSANGTLVNGIRLTAPHVLRHGERIGIGDTELVYQEPGQAFKDTMPMAGASAAAREAADRRVARPPAGLGQARGPRSMSRGLMTGLILAGALLLLALAAAVVYFVAPDVYERIGLVSPASPTALPVAATSAATQAPAVTETGAPVATPEPPTAEPTGDGAQEMADLLIQAEALTRRSKFEDAEAIYEELSARAPEDARPEAGWAWALILDDRAQDALPHAQRAAELDPEDAGAAAMLGRAYLDLGDGAEALVHAEKAVELQPANALALAILAEVQMAAGQMNEAVENADLALVQDINNAEAHRVRGWLYHLASNDMGRAASELQIAAGLQPELWLRRHDLGVLLLEAEDYVTSIMALQDALAIRPKGTTYAAIGEAYYRLGQYDQARASLQQALSDKPEDLATQARLAATYAHLNRCEEAATYYEAVLEGQPDDPLALEAEALCQAGEPVPTPSPTVPPAAGPTPVATTAAAATSAVQPTARPASLSGRIAFPAWNRERGGYDTYVANADGSGRALVVEYMHQPAFSPDGAWLAVNGERGDYMNMFLVKPDGSGLKEISANHEDELADWSPDGRSLAFSSTRHGDKQSRVYVADELNLAAARKPDVRPLNFGPDDVRGGSPAWAGNDQIVYSGCDVTQNPAPCGLYVMSSAAGAHATRRITDRGEDTAPDVHGNRVAFMSNREGNWEIYVVNTDGSGLRRLTNNAANDGLPAWAPDGRAIAFVSDQEGGWAVWAMNPDGSGRRKLFPIGDGGLVTEWWRQQISWAP
ncbi:MAG: FHA domain-containing protein [Anaerolineaceae bacterium]|nr:FHA domain-containing protein [Anaerolineaceae bacterium]